MPKLCLCCTHPETQTITRLLVRGASERSLAARFGMSSTSVHRHKRCIRDAIDRSEMATGITAKAVIGRLVKRLEDMSEDCHTAGERKMFLLTADRLARSGEVFGKLNGEISSGGTNVLLMNLGVRDERELRAAVELSRASSAVSLEEALEDGLALVQLVIRERPDARTAVLARMRLLVDPSGAELVDGGEVPPVAKLGGNGDGRAGRRGPGNEPP